MIAANPALVIAAVRGWLGTPYHDQASLKGVGCDCLGLVRGVWRELFGAEPLPLPPYSRDWGEAGSSGAVAKHCCILVAADRFIHAYERTGVIEESLTAAWRRRIAFAFLFPAT